MRMGVVMRIRVRMNLNAGLGRGMRMFMFVRMVMRVVMVMVVVVRNGVVVVMAAHAVGDPNLAVFATVARHA